MISAKQAAGGNGGVKRVSVRREREGKLCFNRKCKEGHWERDKSWNLALAQKRGENRRGEGFGAGQFKVEGGVFEERVSAAACYF